MKITQLALGLVAVFCAHAAASAVPAPHEGFATEQSLTVRKRQPFRPATVAAAGASLLVRQSDCTSDEQACGSDLCCLSSQTCVSGGCCDAGEQACGSEGCYNPSTEVCCSSSSANCPTGYTCCTGDFCCPHGTTCLANNQCSAPGSAGIVMSGSSSLAGLAAVMLLAPGLL